MNAAAQGDPATLARRVRELGTWFHNIDLNGVQTAPNHFLNDYPNVKWRLFQHAVPQDLAGKSVLDIGCNAGFYSLEMKRRGAGRVLGVDFDDRYLEQARFAEAANTWGDKNSAAAFAKELQSNGLNHLEIGNLSEPEGAAGSIFVTMPVVFYQGTKRSPATVTLRRVNDVDGSTQAQRRSHIERIEWSKTRTR